MKEKSKETEQKQWNNRTRRCGQPAHIKYKRRRWEVSVFGMGQDVHQRRRRVTGVPEIDVMGGKIMERIPEMGRGYR